MNIRAYGHDGLDGILYDHVFNGPEGELSFYLEEAERAGSPVLELGCGTGRFVVPLLERGLSVVGIDSAPGMLAAARRKVARLDAATRRRVKLVQGDMRCFALEHRFRLVIVPNSSFLHLLSTEDQRRALTCIRSHLTEGGRLILNLFDHSGRVAALDAACSDKLITEKQGNFTHPVTGRRGRVLFSYRLDRERQLMDGSFTFTDEEVEDNRYAKLQRRLTLRYVYPREMEQLLEENGFTVEALYGDFQRGPFQPGGEQIWVARRR